MSAVRSPQSPRIGVAAVLLLLGCVDAPTVVPVERPGPPEPLIPSLTMTCTAGVFTQFYASAGWDCNSTVQFYSNNSSLAQSVANAVGEWQTRLAATGFSDLPTFTTTSVLTQAEATATGTHLGSAFCGNWDNDSRVLQVFSDTGCGVEFDNKGPLANLLLQKWGTR